VKTIRNKTLKPLRISFSGGKVLHLGPAKTGQIPDPAVEEKSIRALVESGRIEVIDAGGAGRGGGEGGSSPHAEPRGHPPTTSTTRRGDR
jgi:hypothetical protein